MTVLTKDVDSLETAESLYDRGLFVQAWKSLQPKLDEDGRLRSPLVERWADLDARNLFARLFRQLGGDRASETIIRRAYREAPRHPQTLATFAISLSDTPLRAWRFLLETDFPEREGDAAATWNALHARILCRFRDFDRAEEWVRRARDADPNNLWAATEAAGVLFEQEKLDEAILAFDEILNQQPWYRPAVLWRAHGLTKLNQDEESLAFLAEADQHLESYPITWHRIGLLHEMERWEELLPLLDRIAWLAPLRESSLSNALLRYRFDAAHAAGDWEQVTHWLREWGGEIAEQTLSRLADPALERKRLILPVPFVAQHHVTCSPATVTAITRFWGAAFEHVEISEEICYDGTPGHKLREWCEQHGFEVREFTVTWESACQVLDRGIPFGMSTVSPTSSHMQAVVGYDTVRHTFLVRDSNTRYRYEYNADVLLKDQASTGPHGYLILPSGSNKAADLELPDEDLYARAHAVFLAIERNDRIAAAEGLEQLRNLALDHSITHWLTLALAMYDGNDEEILRGLRPLREAFPEDVTLLLREVWALAELGRRQDQLDLFETAAKSGVRDAALWMEWANVLAADPGQIGAALRLLDRCHRCYHGGDALMRESEIRSGLGEREAALELARLASCLEDTNEAYAGAYFELARKERLTESALDFLRRRYLRYRSKSGRPAATLVGALVQLDRTRDAFALASEALAARPADGPLRVALADLALRMGEFDQARQWLAEAEGKCRRGYWLDWAATMNNVWGDAQASLRYARELAELQPISRVAHEIVADRLTEFEGSTAAIEYLRAVVERFPHSLPLHQLYVQRLRDSGGDERIAALRHLIENHPTDVWARSELAIVLSEEGDYEQALVEADAAVRATPARAASYTMRGAIHRRAANIELAEADFRRAIELSADDDFAIYHWIGLHGDPIARREVLAFIRAEMIRQVLSGGGLPTYASAASEVLPLEEVLDQLREVLEARPDLTQAWLVVARHLAIMKRWDESLEVAEECVGRFPYLVEGWLELGRIRRGKGEGNKARAAFEEASRLEGGAGMATRELADWLASVGERQSALEVLEKAVRRAGRNSGNRGYLADVLWSLGQHERAIEEIREALLLDPGYGWAWEQFQSWMRTTLGSEANDRIQEFARELNQRFPGNAATWLYLSQTTGEDEREERLRALDHAICLFPSSLEAHDQRVVTLAELERFDEALAACEPPIWKSPPLILRGRRGWVLKQLGEIDTAIAEWEACIAEDPAYSWAWRELLETLSEHRSVEDRLDAARKWTEHCPENQQAWSCLLHAQLNGGGTDEEILETGREAIALEPTPGYASYVMLRYYVDTNRIPAARELCQACRDASAVGLANFGETLLGIAADDAEQIEKAFTPLAADIEVGASDIVFITKQLCEKGHDGIAERALLAAAPSDPLCYRLGDALCALDDWMESKGHTCRRVTFAQALQTTCTDWAPAWGIEGAAHAAQGHWNEAIEAYKQAIELQPAYFYAARGLLDVCIQTKRFAEGADALERISQDDWTPDLISRAVVVRAETHEPKEALATFETLCEQPNADLAHIEFAFVGLPKKLRKSAWKKMSEVTKSPDISNQRFMAWCHIGLLFKRVREVESTVVDRCKTGQWTMRFVASYLSLLWIRGLHFRVYRFIVWHRKWLRSDDQTWGSVAAILGYVGMFRLVVRWMRDWRDRPNADPWMLENLSHALRVLDRWDEALEVNQQALALPRDSTYFKHALDVAFELADRAPWSENPDADQAEAMRLFRSFSLEDLAEDAHLAFTNALVHILLHAEGDGAEGALDWCIHQLQSARQANAQYRSDHLGRTRYRRVLGHLRRRFGRRFQGRCLWLMLWS